MVAPYDDALRVPALQGVVAAYAFALDACASARGRKLKVGVREAEGGLGASQYESFLLGEGELELVKANPQRRS